MNELPVPIDKIVAKHEFALSEVDQVYLEWYEVHKRRLTRNTTGGKTIFMQLEQGAEWRHGDALFHQETLQAILVVSDNSLFTRLFVCRLLTRIDTLIGKLL